ncbi:MAG: regulatory signaling modulator protein AmpE [Gammaproteobacteria bacterium]|nr:regulatory signaling modulator protein AmpE [Gammaproteobacteria bacterium]
MTMITILLALILDRLMTSHKHWRSLCIFNRYVDGLMPRLKLKPEQAYLGIFAVLLIPISLLLFGQTLVAGVWLDLFSVALGAVVLLVCLGPLDWDWAVDKYLKARKRGDDEVAHKRAYDVMGEQPPQDKNEQILAVTRTLLIQSGDQLLAVLFWFVIFGPAGAMAYRFSAHLVNDPPHWFAHHPQARQAARYWLGWFGWLPTRMVAVGYALTGSFDDVVQRLKELRPLAHPLDGNHTLLLETGCAALHKEVNDLLPHGYPHEVPHLSLVRSARALALRTLLVWLSLLSLLTLVGWFA